MTVVQIKLRPLRERIAATMFNEWNRRGNWPCPIWRSASKELREDWLALADLAIMAMELER